MKFLSDIRSFGMALSLGAMAGGVAGAETREEEVAMAELGEKIFFDTSLSNPPGLGCVSCHQPASAFADPRPVSPGAKMGAVGKRNAPSLLYAALIPNRSQEDLLDENGEESWVWQGGYFQDGRARTLENQIRGPFFDAQEMNLAGEADLAYALRRTGYAEAMKLGLGEEAWSDDSAVARRAYRALVSFLKQPAFRPFDSKLDAYLAGDTKALDEREKRGLAVFEGKGKCADCHLLRPSVWPLTVLSDFGYDNLGVPSRGEKDPGLGAHTGVAEELGQFRSPTLRNIALTAPYFHNGSVATLREVVEFYNKRDVEPDRWGATDYPETVNRADLGNLGLSEEETEDLVAFLEAMTDRSVLAMIERGDTLPEPPAGTPASWEMRAYFSDWNRLAPVPPPHPPHRGPWPDESPLPP